MTYPQPLQGETGSTAEERRAEADRILRMVADHTFEMTDKEQQFVEDCDDGRPITPRMLFWLRDIKEKYV